jgi:hypothetical protein
VTVAHLGQSGLGLPSREYYLADGVQDEAYRRAYARYADRLLELAAADGALPVGSATARAALEPASRAALVARVLAFETDLARACAPAASLRDPDVYYRPQPSLAALQGLTDGGEIRPSAEGGGGSTQLFRWETFVEAYHGRGRDRPALPSPIVLSGEGYFRDLFSTAVRNASVCTLVAYLQLTVLQEYAHHLSAPYASWLRVAPIKHGHSPIQHGRFSIKNGQFPIKHGHHLNASYVSWLRVAPALCASSAPWPPPSCLEAWGVSTPPNAHPRQGSSDATGSQRGLLEGSPKTRALLCTDRPCRIT